MCTAVARTDRVPVEIGLSPVTIDRACSCWPPSSMSPNANGKSSAEAVEPGSGTQQHRVAAGAVSGAPRRADGPGKPHPVDEIVDHHWRFAAGPGPSGRLVRRSRRIQAVTTRMVTRPVITSVRSRGRLQKQSGPPICARLGGDEFVLVLVNTSMQRPAAVVGNSAIACRCLTLWSIDDRKYQPASAWPSSRKREPAARDSCTVGRGDVPGQVRSQAEDCGGGRPSPA